jgi:transcriptional regulator with XRE-family HTH domain
MKFGEKLQKIRKRHRLSQEVLAERIGVTSNHLSRLERSRFQPSAEILKRLAQVLNVSTDYLLSEGDEPTTEVRIENQPLAERMKLLNTLDESEQQVVITLIDALLTKKKILTVLAQLTQSPNPLQQAHG